MCGGVPDPPGGKRAAATVCAPRLAPPPSPRYLDPILAAKTSNFNAAPGVLPLDSPNRRRLPPLLRRAWYGLNQAFRRCIAHTGVTPDQFTALRTLLEGDPDGLTQRDLTLAMSSDPNTVASLLERMAAAGWVERKPHERDRRAYRIRLLPAGRERFEIVRELAVALQSDVLAVLPEPEREHFLEQLDLVGVACRQAAAAAPRSRI